MSLDLHRVRDVHQLRFHAFNMTCFAAVVPGSPLCIPLGAVVLVECGLIGKVARHVLSKQRFVTAYHVTFEEETDDDAEEHPLHKVFLFIDKHSVYPWPDGARSWDSEASGKNGFNGRAHNVKGCGFISGVALNMHNKVSHYRMSMRGEEEVFFRCSDVEAISNAGSRRKPKSLRSAPRA